MRIPILTSLLIAAGLCLPAQVPDPPLNFRVATSVMPVSSTNYAWLVAVHRDRNLLCFDFSGNIWASTVGANGDPGPWRPQGRYPADPKPFNSDLWPTPVVIDDYLVVPDQPSSYVAALGEDGTILSWSQAPGRVNPSWARATVTTSGRSIYAAGGWWYGELDDVEVATLAADGTLSAWRTLTPLPKPVNGAHLEVIDSYLYLFSGTGAGGDASRSAEVWRARVLPDGSLGLWELRGSTLRPRPGTMHVRSSNRLYLAGGGVHGDNDGGTVESSPAASFGIAAEARYEPSLPTPLNAAGFASTTRRGYIFGGARGSYATDRTNQILVADFPGDAIPPKVTDFVVAPATQAVGGLISLSAAAEDTGGSGLASWSYTINGGAAVQTALSGNTAALAAPVSFPAASVNEICVVARDGAGNVSQPVCQFAVAYDPNGGFVTGGGWIQSPVGAFTANPSLTGTANFGFVSKYQNGATTPSGNTNFVFHAAGLYFRSTEYQWLVVGGAKAQFRGSGAVNGVGGYSFLLTAVDGALAGGGPDRFRIKITGPGGLVYDNMAGSGDDVEPATALGGGSIVIHRQ